MTRKSFPERAASMFGVPGRFYPAHARDALLFDSQTWISERRTITGYGDDAQIQVTARYDDQCKNGHNTFSITADVTTPRSRARRDIEAGGCLHDEIAVIFPELAPLIRWHLTSSDGPMHYLGNTIYLAGDRDCHGLRQGERRQIINGRTKELAWHLVAVDNATGEEKELHELPKYADGPEAPALSFRLEYRPWSRIGEGKARQLDAARNCAVWPDATDEELSADADTLRAALLARLPALLSEFQADMVRAGFHFTAEN
jgi:hypothetical protein